MFCYETSDRSKTNMLEVEQLTAANRRRREKSDLGKGRRQRGGKKQSGLGTLTSEDVQILNQIIFHDNRLLQNN